VGEQMEKVFEQPARAWARRWLRIGALLCAAALLLSTGTGCSIRKIVYGWVPRLLVGRVTDTFDLDRAQKKALQARVAALHEWHRHNELPRYVQLLEQLEQKIQDGVTPEEARWLFDELGAAGERMAHRVAPETGEFLTLLRDEQIAHAEGEMKKTEKERFERLEKPEDDYVAFRLKQAKKNFKTWLGSYTDAQLGEWERLVRKNRIEELRRREGNQRNQRDFLAALRSRPGAQALSDLVLRWVTKFEVNETPAYQQAEKRTQEDFVDTIVRMDKLLSPAQRQHLIEELRSWRTDFAELSGNQ
jgi:hypothetical protein